MALGGYTLTLIDGSGAGLEIGAVGSAREQQTVIAVSMLNT